jgi:peptidoglycan/xylan/chitin deacetylase (PgdA/CDA1 family)
LPWNGPAPPEGREVATQRLLGSLEAHGAPAAGFVTCGRVPADAPILKLWLDRGMMLGNHSEAHRDLNNAPLDLWLQDVRTCDARLEEVVGGAVRFFRYPMLHQGPTDERQQAALELLRELDYRIAHVTVDNSEWMLSRPYEEALRSGDQAKAKRIGRLLIEHIVSVVHHAQDVARRKVGRDVDQVLLLHATELVADHIDALLDTLTAEGFLFISLEEALADPVFQLPDAYTGPKGLSWLYRIEPLDPEDVAWDDAQAEALGEALQVARN